MENPGMFKLVYPTVNTTSRSSDMGTYHEGPGQDPLDLKSLLVQGNPDLPHHTWQLELARSAEVVHEEHDAVLALERHETALGVGRICEEIKKLGHKRFERGYGRDSAVARLVVDAHADLNFVVLQVRLCRGGAGDVAMLEADAYGTEVRGDVLGDVVDLIEAASALGQRAGDLVDEYGPGETSASPLAWVPGSRR